MTRKRNNKKVNEMYKLYQKGNSLQEVAKAFGVTRQSVYKAFSIRKFDLRKRPEPKIKEFNGNRYSLRPSGYYAKTTGNRKLMHRDVWEYYNGSIPRGWDIHHKDEDKTNNNINNLECLPKSEHTRIYSPHNNQYTKGRKRKTNASA